MQKRDRLRSRAGEHSRARTRSRPVRRQPRLTLDDHLRAVATGTPRAPGGALSCLVPTRSRDRSACSAGCQRAPRATRAPACRRPRARGPSGSSRSCGRRAQTSSAAPPGRKAAFSLIARSSSSRREGARWASGRKGTKWTTSTRPAGRAARCPDQLSRAREAIDDATRLLDKGDDERGVPRGAGGPQSAQSDRESRPPRAPRETDGLGRARWDFLLRIAVLRPLV